MGEYKHNSNIKSKLLFRVMETTYTADMVMQTLCTKQQIN